MFPSEYIRYKTIIGLISYFFQMNEYEIMNLKKSGRKKERTARIVFYKLCIRYNVCLYKAALINGKHRTCFVGNYHYSKQNIDFEVEKIINLITI